MMKDTLIKSLFATISSIFFYYQWTETIVLRPIFSTICGIVLCLFALSIFPSLEWVIKGLNLVTRSKSANRYSMDHLLLNLPDHPSTWMNLGNWKSIEISNKLGFVDACEGLAESLAEAVQFRDSEIVIDVGYGCGDQDIYFLEKYPTIGRIIGINSSESQYREAQRKVIGLGLQDKFEPRLGTAPHLGFTPESADVVLSLDSAYHYNTRKQFFDEVHKILRSSGRIGLVDLVIRSNPASLWEKIGLFILSKLVGIPTSNLYNLETYSKILNDSGFDVVVAQIVDNDPFSKVAMTIDQKISTYSQILNSSTIKKFGMTSYMMKKIAAWGKFDMVLVIGKKRSKPSGDD